MDTSVGFALWADVVASLDGEHSASEVSDDR
jgi:hypothetical protein